jgi:hypothetical protein
MEPGQPRSHEPLPPPARLFELRDWKNRMEVLLENFDDHPENLDPEAANIQTGFVIPAYQVMKTDVAKASGQLWDNEDRKEFRRTYQTVAKKWPTYKSALAVLDRAPEGSTVYVDAMERLEEPRSGYIEALLGFYEVFSATLDSLFPP